MKLVLHRKYLKNNYTIGKLYLDKGYGQLEWICDTIEDKVRDLTKEKKVYGKTAIPFGEYEITMNVVSPKYSNYNKYPKYKKYSGRLPRLLNVPMFDGVLIHIGNDETDSAGCVIVGENKLKGKVINSTNSFYRLMDNYLLPASRRGEKITLSIV